MVSDMFEVTPELIQFIESSGLSDDTIQKLSSLPSISRVDFVKVYQLTSKQSLLQFIKQCKTKLYVEPTKEEPPKTKEFLKSMDKLRSKAQEEEYQRLINTAPSYDTLYEQNLSEKELTPIQEHKQLKSHITTIFNILISVASVAYAIWYWTSTLWALSTGYRVLLCLFFAFLVLIAEVVVYMSYLRKVDEARTAERAKEDKKNE